MEASPPFKFNFFDLKIQKTEAASVEETTEPKSIPKVKKIIRVGIPNRYNNLLESTQIMLLSLIITLF